MSLISLIINAKLWESVEVETEETMESQWQTEVTGNFSTCSEPDSNPCPLAVGMIVGAQCLKPRVLGVIPLS